MGKSGSGYFAQGVSVGLVLSYLDISELESEMTKKEQIANLQERCKTLAQRLETIHNLVRFAQKNKEEIPWKMVLEISEGDVGPEDEAAQDKEG